MTTAALDQLSRWRSLGARRSEEVVDLAPGVLRSGKLGDQEWSIREQLAIAAFDIGQIKLATEQLDILQKRFAGSPRVAIIHGLRLEARGDTTGATKVYQDLLVEDETNVSAHQRIISLSLSSPTNAIPHILKYLDTFYSDAPAWSLLAEIYADLGLYAQSLTALGHVMVLQTWDSAAVTRAGETAYTLGDYQLALKYFLRATEMESDATQSEGSSRKSRSWWGVKLSSKRLLEGKQASPSAAPEKMIPTDAQLRELDALATERLLAVGGEGLEIRRKVLAGDFNETIR